MCTKNPSQNAWRVCHGGHQHWCADWWDKKGRRCICRSTYERACNQTPHSCSTGTDADYIVILNDFVANGKPQTVTAAEAGIFFDCGPTITGDVIPPQETALIVYAETIAETYDNATDSLTDPENVGVNPDIRWTLCNKAGFCVEYP